MAAASEQPSKSPPRIANPSSVVDAMRFFRRLLRPDADDRASALKVSLPCPPRPPATQECLSELHDALSGIQEGPTPRSDQINALFAVAARIACECPFRDVRDGFRQFLAEMKDLDTHGRHCSRPSSFFPVPSPDAEDRTARLYEGVFLMTGRLDHLIQLLGWHPPFLQAFYLAYSLVVREPGPLPLPWRNYLALLAASQFDCSYLLSLHEEEFLLNDGDVRWLEGPSFPGVPEKLRGIGQLNAVMAHQPWRVKVKDVEYLLNALGWSATELAHAVVILATFHSLASVVHGAGVQPDLDTSGHWAAVPLNEAQQAESTTARSATLEMVDLLRATETSSGEEEEDTALFAPDTRTTVVQRRLAAFERSADGVDPDDKSHQMCELAVKYAGANPMKHEDFDVNSEEYRVFRVQDFSWTTDGHALLSRFYPAVAPLLEEEMNMIFEMTDRQFGDEGDDIDTSPFRRAIWYYTQRLLGISNDDYFYANVNRFLNIETKTFIKKVVCDPPSVRLKDVQRLGFNLRPAEKLHVTLLASEARKQAELMYVMHAFSRALQG